MTDVTFLNSEDTNLRDINQANITDATAKGYTFTGIIGSTFAILDSDSVVAISNGQCTVESSGTPTYVAIKGTGGALGLYTVPQIPV